MLNWIGEERSRRISTDMYQELCRMGGCELEFTPGAIRLIAAEAMGRGTGGHALHSVCAELMLDLLYTLPDTEAGGRRTIDEQFVRGRIRRGGQRVEN
jgi:ATP-dependent Clp protease ATP-binding subunit ClpX